MAGDGLAPIVAELAELLGAAGGVVAGIEDQDDVAAAQRGEGDGAAGSSSAVKSGAGAPAGRGSEKSQESMIATVCLLKRTGTVLLYVCPLVTTIGRDRGQAARGSERRFDRGR